IANSDGNILIGLVHHLSSEVYKYEATRPLAEYARCRRLAYTQIKCLIEGEDFEIMPDGEFKFH
ncbi:MAG: hypothetical protein IKP67_10585, partial [Spirochaetales bacterium]|nr:hypothetical protein [Spirochaetales bacterium]